MPLISEYLEACDSYLPGAGIDYYYYYYDQLGSGFSDQPDEPSLWEASRFADEVEQVRQALGLDRGNAYAERELMPAMDQAALAEIRSLEAAADTHNPRYMELLTDQHYIHHVLRMPAASCPDPVLRTFAHINEAVYVPMQGPSDLGIAADAKLARWDRTQDLASIGVPALVIGASHDTMDPAHMRMMASRLPRGQYLHCPDGSHMAMYDDQLTYFAGLIDFLASLPG